MTLDHLFWDTCVFIRYITNDKDAPHFGDIARFVEEVKAKKRTVYYSTLTIAEMDPKHFIAGPYGTVDDFFDDLGSSCIPIEPNPNIVRATAWLRNAKSTNPNNPATPGRPIATPDAILMMTAVYVRDAMGVDDLVMHSTDQGKNKNWYDKCVPIVGFERWFPEKTRTPYVSKVCSLPREVPRHPTPMLDLK